MDLFRIVAARPVASIVAVLLVSAAAALLLPLILMAVSSIAFMRFYRKQGVLGSRWLPLLGDVLFFVEVRKQRKADYPSHIFRLLGERVAQQNGQAASGACPPYFFAHFGPLFMLVLRTPDVVRYVMANPAIFQKTTLARAAIRPILGTGLLLAEGAQWRLHRRMMNPAFAYDSLRSMLPLMSAAVNDMIDRNYTVASERDIHEDVSSLALDIVGQAAFGRAVSDPRTTARVYDAVNKLMVATVTYIYMMLPLLAPTAYEALFTWAYKPQLQAMRGMVMSAVAARRAERAAGAVGVKTMLLDLLLDAHDAGGDEGTIASTDAPSQRPPVTLTDAELADECITFIMAGHETTAQSLGWTLLLLAQHEEWKTRARAEVMAVVGSSRDVTHEHLQALPILTWILNESLRMYPPVPEVHRVAVEDVTDPALPFRIARGTTIIIPSVQLHYDTDLWEAPHEFRPQRWQGGIAATLKHPYAYMPFSGGPRACIGMQFALLELRIALISMLRDCDWAVLPSYVHSPMMALTLRPAHGLPMRVWKRK